ELREALQDLVRELAEWRLAVYLRRSGDVSGADRIVCRVFQSGVRPILKLPDRDQQPGIQEGWRAIVADGEDYQAKFVKIAVNVVARPGSDQNVLPGILRRWFGPEAGQPGRAQYV